MLDSFGSQLPVREKCVLERQGHSSQQLTCDISMTSGLRQA